MHLTSGVYYPSYSIESNWFLGNINLSELDIDMANIIVVEKYAFVNRAFANVTSLVLRNLAIHTFHANTFSGLVSLRTLKFYSLQTMAFSPGFLAALTHTLRFFITNGPEIEENVVHQLNPLTGGLTFPSLRFFKAEQNLRDSLNAHTFTGIRNVRILVLSNCAIETIGNGTFEPVQSSLDKLYLDGNRLKWLSADFFSIFEPQGYFNVYLSNNAWNCNCDLAPMQNMLVSYRYAFDDDEIIMCKTPWHLSSTKLVHANLCEDSTSTETAYPTTFETNSTVETSSHIQLTTPKYTQMFPQCPSALNLGQYETLYLYFNGFPFQLTPNGRGELLLTTNVNIDESFVLIWFPNAENSNLFIDQLTTGNISCFSQLHRNFLITDLLPDTAYTFCIMSTIMHSISPFDCASYYHRTDTESNFWLNAKDYQVWIIAAFAVGILLAFMLGLCSGLWCLRQNYHWLTYNKRALNAKETMPHQSADVHHNNHEILNVVGSTGGISNKYVNGKELNATCNNEKYVCLFV